VFELLKRHLYLAVSAIAMMIDLDDYIFGSQNRFYQGIPVAVSGDVITTRPRRKKHPQKGDCF
jgi:hypothetical protein